MNTRAWIAILLMVWIPGGLYAKTHKHATPMSVLKQKYLEMKKVIKKYPDQRVMRDHLRQIMETFIDYEQLSALTLPGTWDKLKKKQRKEFVDQFKQMIQRTYVNKFNANQKFSITYNGKVKYMKGGKAFVSTTIHSGRSEAQVDYSFHKKRGKWWAYDVIIDEISMMRKYRRQFVRIVRRSGFDSLLNKIRNLNIRRRKEAQQQEKADASKGAQSEP